MTNANPAAPDESQAVVTTQGPRAADQKLSPANNEVIVGTTPVDSSRLGALLEERADTRSLSVGPFAVAAFQDQQAENRRLMDRLDRERDRVEDLTAQLGELRTKNAVLQTKIEEVTKRRRLKVGLVGIGGAVLGTGLGGVLQSGVFDGSGVALFLLGALLLLLGLPMLKGED